MNFFDKSVFISHLNVAVFVFVNNLIYHEYDNDVLLLKNPRLLEPINRIKNKSFENLDINSGSTSVADIKSLSPNKFEKKYRSTLIEHESLKTKKIKNKYVKNRRSSIESVNEMKISIGTSADVLNDESIEESAIKSRRAVAKNNKKNKPKILPSINKAELDSSKILISNVDINNTTLSKKAITLNKPLTISELSSNINISEAEIITYLFLNKSISATINDLLDVDTLSSIIEHYGFDVTIESSSSTLTNLVTTNHSSNLANFRRNPIITILGHVDHGKTTLLDAILKTNLVNKENGGITQAISGYEVTCHYKGQERQLVFLDTPGHESFKSMRIRGAQVTDIILLVIAADDGLRPQTIEVIKYIVEMQLSSIVVLTKSDKLKNNVQKIKQDLYSHNLVVQDLGGNTPFIQVNALVGYNIDLLLSELFILADKKNLTADREQLAFGMIIESYLDKKKGPIANIVIQNGTLRISQFITSDKLVGKVKSINNVGGIKVESSGPSSVVQVLGFHSVPRAGSVFYSFDKEIKAREHISSNLSEFSAPNTDLLVKSLNTKINVDMNSRAKRVNFIIKTDTQGSLEAILDVLSTISQTKVQINIISVNFGCISNTDVELALTTNASIIAFNVDVLPQIIKALKKSDIDLQVFNVVYDLFEYVKNKMLDLVDVEYDYISVGSAIVKTVFKTNKGYVAGCLVTKGKLSKTSYICVYRNDHVEYEGFITSLRHLKSNVDEVSASTECGIMSKFELWQPLDIIEVYELVTRDKIL